MDNSFKALIDSAQEVLILLPSKHHLDQVASATSLYLSLTESGKTTSLSCPVPMVTEYSRLIGVDKITSDLGNKNLVINLVNYDANSVDKVSYDILDGQFKLTISPKMGFKSPTKEQVNINYSGASGDLVVLIGGDNNLSFPALTNEEIKSSKMIHIGTKLLESTSSELQILSFAKPASSVSELVANLINESSLPISADIATNLLSGIEEQSKNFQGEGVSPDTFEIFAELLKLGGIRTPKIVPAQNYPQGAIPTRPFTQVQSTVTNHILQSSHLNDKQMTPEEAEEELNQEIPPSWSEPKIFTGTTVS